MLHIVLAFVATFVLVSCGENAAVVEQQQEPTPTTLTITVDGMTCGGCSSAITETLETIPGVSAITVDHKTGKAVITTTGDPTLPAKLSSSINELGYKATLP